MKAGARFIGFLQKILTDALPTTTLKHENESTFLHLDQFLYFLYLNQFSFKSTSDQSKRKRSTGISQSF